MVPPLLLGRFYTGARSVALLRNCAREMGTMRSAENASGHARERLGRRPLTRTNRAGALAGDVAERAPEGAEALPAGVQRDLGDGEIGVAEQRGRPLDAPSEEISVRGDTERSLERSREVSFGDAAHA